MEHYNQQHWSAYLLNIVDEEERIIMENHLYNCDQCMDLYINQLEAENEELAEPSTTFTKTVMKGIFKEEQRKNKAQRITLFKYYTIAASITLILVATGVFNSIGNMTPEIMSGLSESTRKIETAMFGGWSQELFDKSRDLTKLFHINLNLKE